MKNLQFKNPANGYVEKIESPALGVLLIGPFYFAVKGAWSAFGIGAVLTIITGGLAWLVLPFGAEDMFRKSYLSRGWEELECEEKPGNTKALRPPKPVKRSAEHQRKLDEAARKMGWK